MKKIFLALLAAGLMFVGCTKEDGAKQGKTPISFNIATVSFDMASRATAPELKFVDGDLVGITIQKITADGVKPYLTNVRFGVSNGKLISTTPYFFPLDADSIIVSAVYPYDPAGQEVSTVKADQSAGVSETVSAVAAPVRAKVGDAATLTFAPTYAYLTVNTSYEPIDEYSFAVAASTWAVKVNDEWKGTDSTVIYLHKIAKGQYDVALPAQDLSGRAFLMDVNAGAGAVSTYTWTMPDTVTSKLQPGTCYTLDLKDAAAAAKLQIVGKVRML